MSAPAATVREQVRTSIRAQIRATPDWSNRRIAALFGVHHSRITPIRAALEATGEIARIGIRVLADGRIADTDRMGGGGRPKRAYGGAELTGRRFGRLVVLSMQTGCGQLVRWLCRCDCGNEVTPVTGSLTSGHTTSCGCYWRSIQGQTNLKHGKSRTQVHRAWVAMRKRCTNPNEKAWKHYGGRGITVCERWQSFETFYTDMGDPPSGTSLDRIDVNGNYEPGNCRWATDLTQARNTRANRLLTMDGRTQTMSAWSEETGVNYQTLASRIQRGISVELAVRPCTVAAQP